MLHSTRLPSQTQHFWAETYLNSLRRTVQAAGATVPALFRVFDNGDLLTRVKMNDVERAVVITGRTFRAFFKIDDRRHLQAPSHDLLKVTGVATRRNAVS